LADLLQQGGAGVNFALVFLTFAALNAGLIWLYHKLSSLIRFAPLFAYILGHNYRSVGAIKRAAETLYGRRSNDADR